MDAPQIRLKARESLKGEYWYAVLTAFVASIFGALLVNGGSFSVNVEERFSELVTNLPAIIKWYLMIVGSAAGALSLVNLILGGVIQVGYADYLLKQHDREIHSTKDIFSKFDYFCPGLFAAASAQYLYCAVDFAVHNSRHCQELCLCDDTFYHG